MLVGGLIVLWSSFGFIHWMLFFGLGTLALGFGGLYYAWKRVGVQFHLKNTFTAFPAVVRTFMRYSVMTTVVTFGLSTIDIQMLSLLTDYSSVGIYGIAFFMGSVIDGIKRPINQMLAPQFAKAWNTNNTTMLSKLYKKTATMQVLVNVLMVVMILSNIDWIFSLIPNSERFNAAIPVVGWVLPGPIHRFLLRLKRRNHRKQSLLQVQLLLLNHTYHAGYSAEPLLHPSLRHCWGRLQRCHFHVFIQCDEGGAHLPQIGHAPLRNLCKNHCGWRSCFRRNDVPPGRRFLRCFNSWSFCFSSACSEPQIHHRHSAELAPTLRVGLVS